MPEQDSVVRGLADDPELQIEIRVGIEFWRNGEITLRVRGDGGVEVLQRRSGKERRFDARLDGPRVRALGEELAGEGLTAFAPQPGDREPDDMPVMLRVARNGDVLHEAVLSYGDRYDDPRLDSVLRRYEALVEEVTEGELPYGKDAR